MAGGAIIGAVVAARQRRIRDILDAFRAADATAPERARTLSELGMELTDEFARLANEGVIRQGDGAGSWYLSEVDYQAREELQYRANIRVLVFLVFAIAGLVVAYWTMTTLNQP